MAKITVSVDIDNELLEKAMLLSGIDDINELIEESIKLLIKLHTEN